MLERSIQDYTFGLLICRRNDLKKSLEVRDEKFYIENAIVRVFLGKL